MTIPQARNTKDLASSWADVPAPHTALQRGAFVDLCTHWFICTNTRTVPQLVERTIVNHTDAVAIRASKTYYNQSEVDMQQRKTCFFCCNASVKHVLANPFAQRCYIVLCADCA